MSSSLDNLELCRLCLVKDRVSVPIFEDEGDVRQIFLKITACLPVKVSREDKLPKKICDDCVYKVELFYQFWNTTANAEKQLLQWLDEVGGLEDKQGYITNVLDSNVMKQERNSDNRLDGNVMQVSGHQNNMDIGMIENMTIMTMPAGDDQQFTAVPMDASGTVQTVQAVPGPSNQTPHDQMAQSQSHLVEEEEEDMEDDNSDDGCDNEEGLPVKEETEDQSDQPLEPTAFVNVPLPCDEAGPSGLQQQKISEISEMSMQQTAADGDPKTGATRRFIFQKKLIRLPEQVTEKVAAAAAKFASEQLTVPVLDVKLEPPDNDFEEVSIDGSGLVHTYAPTSVSSYPRKVTVASGSNAEEIIVFMCKACKVYFPLRSMLVQHAEKVHGSLIKKKPPLQPTMTIMKKKQPAVTIVKKLVQVSEKELQKYQPGTRTAVAPSMSVTRTGKSASASSLKTKKPMSVSSTKPTIGDKNISKPDEDDLDTVFFDGYCRIKSGKYVCNFCDFESFVRTTVSSHSKRKHAEAWDVAVPEEEEAETIAEEKNEVSEEEDEYNWPIDEVMETAEADDQIKVEEDVDDTRKVCPCCPFSTTSSNAYQSHVKRRHRDFWLKSLANKVAALSPANEIKEPLPPGVRQCLHCPFQSKNRSTIYMHTLRKHGPEAAQRPKSDFTEDHLVEEIIETVGPEVEGQFEAFEEQCFEQKSLKCPYCPFETPVTSTMKSHIIRRHRNKDSSNRLRKPSLTLKKTTASPQLYTGYACSFCTFVAATVSSINHHTTREHSGQKQPLNEVPVSEYDCDQCDFKSRSRKHMQMHIRSLHTAKANADGMFTCHMCSYETLTNMGLQRHISIKHNKLRRDADSKISREVYECDECEYKCLNLKLFEWHQRQHSVSGNFDNNAGTFFCNDCEFTTWTKNQLFIHIKRKHRDSEGSKQEPVDPEEHRFACDQCDYTSKSKHVMKVHVIRKHTNEYNHECETCGKKYKVKADLTNHIRFQHREQPIICDVCGKTCRNSNLLYLHQKFAHYKPDFECHICHRRMVSQANLDEHILKQHEQREDVVCEECGKTFTRQARLKIHMRIHTGIKPYSCKICFKAFARRNGLRQHLLIHTGQRPYICDICGKAFTQKTGLISHRKSHPGNHPPLPRVTIDHVLSDLLNEEEEA